MEQTTPNAGTIAGGRENWAFQVTSKGLSIAALSTESSEWTDATPPGWTGQDATATILDSDLLVTLDKSDPAKRRELRASISSIRSGAPHWLERRSTWVKPGHSRSPGGPLVSCPCGSPGHP